MNYYQILNVSENATLQQITQSYYTLSRTWHPDRNSAAEAEARFKEIAEAYDVLKDPEKRDIYTRSLHVRQIRGSEMSLSLPIAGYLTYPEEAFSEKFKRIYNSFYQKLLKEPLAKQRITNLEDKTEVFFTSLKTKINQSENTNSFLSKNKFTPSNLVQDFRQFLKGALDSSDYTSLKNLIRKQINKLMQLPLDQRPVELSLYQGILNIISMVYESGKQSELLSAVQDILFYGQKSSCMFNSKYIEFFALLLQDSNFGNLVSLALKQSWNHQQKHSITFLKQLFTSQKDEKLKADEKGEEPLCQHELYVSAQVFHERLTEKLAPQDFRETAYLCLDYIRILKNSSNVVATNSLIQAIFLFQKAAQLEQNDFIKMTDESLMIQLCILVLETARKLDPLVEFYAYSHCLCIIQHLEFNHPYRLALYEEIKKHALELLGFFPVFSEAQSHLDLIQNHTEQMSLMRDYLQRMVWYVDFNKIHLAQEEILLAQSNVNILTNSYNACLEGHFEAEYSSETAQKLRVQSMEALLEEEGFSWFDISQNVDSDWIGISREGGWLQKNQSLLFHEKDQAYQSLDGIELDYKTGEIKMALKAWNPKDPDYKKSFYNSDIYDLIRMNINHIYLSLDPINAQIKVFQKKVFSPSRLYKTDLLNTVFFADYFLKFLTTAVEVQGHYPYQTRPIDSLINHLPAHLKQIIQEFHKRVPKGEVHRFWFETYAIPMSLENKEEKYRVTFGETRIVLQKNRMKLNEKGELVDTKEAEGWNIYVLTPEQIQEVIQGSKKLEAPSIIVLKNKTSVFFYEGILSKEPLRKAFSKEQLDALNKLKTDENQKICPPPLDKVFTVAQKAEHCAYHHFMYRLTRQITAKAERPHYFSPERIFAEEFTIHFDEFAEHFPILERLKQLNKLAAGLAQMNALREQNLETKKTKEKQLPDTAFWENKEKELIPLIHVLQKEYWTKKIPEERDKKLTAVRANLIENYNKMGNFTYHVGSPEIVALRTKAYAELPKQGFTPDQIEAALADYIPKHVNQLNTAGQERKQNYRTQFYKLYLYLVQQNILTAEAYNDCLNKLMNEGNVAPLAQAIVLHQLLSEFKEQIPGTEVYIRDALNGNFDSLSAYRAKNLAKDQIPFLKERWKTEITQHIQIEDNFEKIGLGSLEKKEIDLSKLCHWVPSSINPEFSKGYYVYGGVVLTPSLLLLSSITKITSALLLASSIALSPVPSYASFVNNNNNNLQWEIKKAEDFVKEVEGEKRKIKSENPFVKVDFSKVDNALQGLNTQINLAKLQPSKPLVDIKPIPVDPFADRGLTFYSLERRNVPLGDILTGITNSLSYTYFPSDSIQCVVLKNQINDLLAGLDNEECSTAFIVKTLTFARRLEHMQNALLGSCHPPTKADLQRMEEAEKNKSIFELTPQEAIDLSKKKLKDAKNFWLNFFTKRKEGQEPPYDLYQSRYRKM